MATIEIEAPHNLPPFSAAPQAARWPLRVLSLGLSLGLGLLGWDWFVTMRQYPAFILPRPNQVWAQLVTLATNGELARHTQTTLTEVLGGLALGVFTAFVLGYLIAKSPLLESMLTPYIVASQAIPVVAIAPLLILWLKGGVLAKVVICALIVFFPVLVNTVHGVRSIAPDLRDLLRSLRASRWQTLVMLEIPAALPILLNGLKIGATLAVIGAVVGEFVGADRGLGYLVSLGQGRYDTALSFVAIAALVLMALVLYGVVASLEKLWLQWR